MTVIIDILFCLSITFPLIQSVWSLILGKKYNVSRNTIRRDARVANVINKIGEISPDVKMNILSGKISITRKQLKELESGTDDDVVDICAVLTDSDYQTARKYWKKLKQRTMEEGNQSVTNCHQLKTKI